MKRKLNATFYGVIVYLILNFLAVLFLKNIRYLFYLHWLILIVILIWSIVFKIKHPNRENTFTKNMDGATKTGYLISQYSQNGIHVFFCYLGFFYLYSIFYLIVAYFTGRDMSNYYIISTLIVGTILATKETILQYSQCIASTISSFDTPKCDKHYYHYWNCVQNKTFEIKEEEEEFM